MIDEELSASVENHRRREEILAAAQAAARRRRRGRQWARAGASAAVVAIAVGLVWRFGFDKPSPRPVVVQKEPPLVRPQQIASSGPVAPRIPTPKKREIIISFITSDPDLSRQWAIPPQKAAWKRLSDDDLLRQLAEGGKPAGLAWVDGRETILFQGQGVAAGNRARGRGTP